MERLGWSGAAVIAGAVAVIILSAYVVTSWPPDPPSATARLATGNRTPTPTPPTTEKTRLVVLGDSFSVSDETGSVAAWPGLLAEDLGWEATTEAVAGTGYVNDADGEAQRFAERLSSVIGLGSDVAIVAGGVNDLGAHPMQQIVTGAEEVVTTLAEEAAPETQVVVVSPFSNGTPGPLTRELNTELQRIANEQGVAYVDATQWLVDEGLFTDPTTPSAKGQRRIANRMERELERLGIAEPTTEPAG